MSQRSISACAARASGTSIPGKTWDIPAYSVSVASVPASRAGDEAAGVVEQDLVVADLDEQRWKPGEVAEDR